MSVDLGDLAGIATAIGLLDDGSPNGDWFEHPDQYLKTILSDDEQRAALLETVDDLLGGEENTTDAAGRTWVPLFANGPVAVSVVVAEADDGRAVHIGVGVRVRKPAAPGSAGVQVDGFLPLFAARGSAPVANPMLLGTTDGIVDVSLSVVLPADPGAGGIELAGAALSARIPTVAGQEPEVGLTLRGLRVPGAAAARDIVVAADEIADLDDALLELVLGLVQASADGLPAGSPASGLVGLLGLVDGDAVPDFPIAELLANGAGALAPWLAASLQGAARADWLGHLARLLGGSVSGAGAAERVSVPVGPVTVQIEVTTSPGAAGLPVVTPRLAVEVTGGPGTSLRLEVQPVSLDLATGAAIALPSLSVLARVASGGGGALLGPVNGPNDLSITVGSFEGGFALDADRRPTLVLQARNARVGTTDYPTLDLTDGDALAGVAGDVVGDAAEALLGPLGAAVGVLVGLSDPPAGPAPRIELDRLLSDPIGALRTRWAALLGADAAIFRSVLATWQSATAAAGLRARAIAGDGTAPAPYRIAVADGVDLLVTVGGTVVSVALAARATQPLALGAQIDADLRIELLRADLSAGSPSAQFATGLVGVVALASAGEAPLRLVAEGYGLSVQGFGARLAWDAAAGARVDPWLDDARLIAFGSERPLTGLGVGGAAALAFPPALPVAPEAWTATIWEAVEAVAGSVLAASGRERAAATSAADPLAMLLTAVVSLTGWAPDVAQRAARLSLAALVADPRAELERWVKLLLGTAGGNARAPELVVGLLAQLLGLPVSGAGVGAQPWALPLPGTTVDAAAGAAVGTGLAFGLDLPALLLALGEPTGERFGSRAPLALLSWRPGDEGLSSDVLAEGIHADAGIDDVLADALAGRAPLADGFDALAERWAGTDGVLALPEDLAPEGLTIHRPSELVHGAKLDAPELAAALTEVWEDLGSTPARLVLVGVIADGEPDLLPPAAPTDVDLTEAGAAVEAFAVPAPAADGTTVVRLGGKASTGTDGFDGQVARLSRALAGLATAAQPVVVVAGASAGRVAVAAAGGLPGIDAVVTVAAPWTPVTLADVDSSPAADGLRMLRTLVDLADADVADEESELPEGARSDAAAHDEDLALARGLVDALLARDGRGDPLTELSAPDRALPAGLAVHAVVGSCAPQAIRRALTAAVAGGLAARSRRRVDGAGADGTRAAVGLHAPSGIGSAAGGLRAALGIDAELLRWGADGLAGPSLAVRLRIAGDQRWLVGGPDGARAPGPRPLALRAMTVELTMPLPSWGTTAGTTTSVGRVILHDATAFGIRRPRWVVDLSSTGPLVPEVRALLGQVAQQLEAQATAATGAAADAAIAGLVDALRALGVLDPSGGFDATTIAGLVANPRATIAAALADATRTADLASGLRRAIGDVRADAGSTIELRCGTARVRLDLAARTATVAATADLGAGGVQVGLDVVAAATGVDVAARLGSDGLAGPGSPAAALELTCHVPVGAAPSLSVSGRLRDPRGTQAVVLWPAGPSTAADLLALVPDAVAATALRAGLVALRSTLAGIAPPAGVDAAALVDSLLRALGLVRAAADAATAPTLVWPSGLLSDPRAWVEVAAGGLTTALASLLDALAGLLPAGAAVRPPGSIAIAPGVALRTAADAGALRILLEVDAAGFGGAAGALALRLAAGLRIAEDGAAHPDVFVDVGVAGAGAVRVRVAPGAGGADPAVGVTVSLLPSSGPEIVIYPAAHGLSGLADAAAAGALAALPALLTRLSAEDPPGAAPATTPVQVAGRIAGRTGSALGLAGGTPAVFSESALAAFASDPAAALQARAADVGAAGLALVVAAVDAVLGPAADRTVEIAEGGRIAIAIGPATRRVTIGWRPSTSALDAAVTIGALPPIGAVAATVRVSPAGVELVDVAVGPASIALDAITLSPFVRVRAGTSLAAPTVDLGLGAAGTFRLLVRIDGTNVALLAASGPLGAVVESGAPADVAAAVVGVLLDVAGGVVLAIDAVDAALRAPVLGTTTAALLEGVLLTPGPDLRLDPGLAADLTQPLRLLRRLAVAVANVAAGMGPITIGGALDVAVTYTGDLLGLTVAVAGDEWILNPGSDVQVGLVTDAEWIDPDVPDGITLEAVRLLPDRVEFAPGVVIGGLGVRLSRSSGPLLDAGITVAAVSALGFGSVRSRADGGVDVGGGARIELDGIGVPLGAGGDGSNPTAAGVMPAGGAGDAAPAPRFSPSLAVQKHAGRELAISLRAGTGNGPWFLTIQREFGPIYIEQVGLAIGQTGSTITTIAVLIDGKVSLFGLSAAVDDLSFTYNVAGTGSPFDGSRWKIDLAGFAVTAEMGGLTLAGGLRKFTPAAGGSEYLGMLLARLGPYGLTVYGGFGEVGPPDDKFTSMFLFGAINGPLGGPPAFFVTGIGGGFGANRGLVVPSDLSQFADYPLIKALDPGARAGDPFTELDRARVYFPAERGQFWFAAGISFNSFALVDGVVVVAIAFGNGFELSILGLARMALPRPQAALVSIELALVARISTREGVVLVQAQLTDNSWLIAPAVRLTGGFAFAAWFGGPNKGQFVVTLGGYHPDFHRDGYPDVPRLGLTWSIGEFITVSGGSYFALTSEALMAGMKVEIHAQIGPAWAHLVFGADGIVFFDPFWLSVTIYASIDAGITIDLWFAEITISIHLSASLTVTGPPFRVVARFEIGPVGVTFEIGPDENDPPPLQWPAFVAKYLEEASPGKARALTAITGRGTVTPAGAATSGGAKSPDGQPDRPYRVVAEFTATMTSAIPLRKLIVAAATTNLATSHTVSVAPMGPGGASTPQVTLRLRRRLTSGAGAGGPDTTKPDRIAALRVRTRRGGAFPIGAWGAAQDLSKPKVPAGDVLSATDQIEIEGLAVIPAGSPPIPYRQVETGRRRILPLLASIADDDVMRVVTGASGLEAALTAAVAEASAAGVADAQVAAHLLSTRGARDDLSVATWQAGLAAPVMLGSLGEGLGPPAALVTVARSAVQPAGAPAIRPPRVLAVLSSGEQRIRSTGDGDGNGGRAGTTVSDELLRAALADRPQPMRVLGPSLASVAERLSPSIPARLVTSAAAARVAGVTVISTGAVPMTSAGIAGGAAVGLRAASRETLDGLAARSTALRAGREVVADGQVLVIELPDADVDTQEDARPALACRSGRVRVAMLAAAGRVLEDTVLTEGERVQAPVGTRTVVAVGGPPAVGGGGPWAIAGGWSAARALPSTSDGLLLAAGAVVDVLGRVPYRGPEPARAAWVVPAELLGRERGTATTIAAPAKGDDHDELVAVAVAVGGNGTEGLAIGIDGARQAGDTLVTADATGAGVLVIALEGAGPDRPVTITVAADPDVKPRDVLGIVAACGRSKGTSPERVDAAAWLAAVVAGADVAGLAPPPTAPGPGTSTIAWEVS